MIHQCHEWRRESGTPHLCLNSAANTPRFTMAPHCYPRHILSFIPHFTYIHLICAHEPFYLFSKSTVVNRLSNWNGCQSSRFCSLCSRLKLIIVKTGNCKVKERLIQRGDRQMSCAFVAYHIAAIQNCTDWVFEAVSIAARDFFFFFLLEYMSILKLFNDFKEWTNLWKQQFVCMCTYDSQAME